MQIKTAAVQSDSLSELLYRSGSFYAVLLPFFSEAASCRIFLIFIGKNRLACLLIKTNLHQHGMAVRIVQRISHNLLLSPRMYTIIGFPSSSVVKQLWPGP